MTRHPTRHRQNLLEVVQGHRIAASLWDDVGGGLELRDLYGIYMGFIWDLYGIYMGFNEI